MSALRLIDELQSQGIEIGLEGESLTLKPKSRLTPDVLQKVKEHKAQIIAVLCVPRLPWQLERLVKAAINDCLKDVALRGAKETKERVKAYALEFFTGGDKAECLKQLWAIYELWQAKKN